MWIIVTNVVHISAWEQHSYQWNILSWGPREFSEAFDSNSFQASKRWKMEREVHPDYLFMRFYIWNSTIRKVFYIWRNNVNDSVKLHRQTTYCISCVIFSQPPSFSWKIRSKNLRSYNSKTRVIRTNIIIPWEFKVRITWVLRIYNKLDLNAEVT